MASFKKPTDELMNNGCSSVESQTRLNAFEKRIDELTGDVRLLMNYYHKQQGWREAHKSWITFGLTILGGAAAQGLAIWLGKHF